MITGTPLTGNVAIHNADSTTGIAVEANSATVNLSVEQKALLVTIAGSASQNTYIGGRLAVDASLDASSITIGSVQLRDGVSGTLGTVKSVGGDNALVVVQDSQPLPTGAAADATVAAGNALLTSILAAQATAANQSTGNASLSTIASGMATAANQGTEIGHLASLDTTLTALNAKFSALGQLASASSVSVVIASDQIVPVSVASIPLPTGAATSANQTTQITSLQSIDTKTPALGMNTIAGSTPVNIASDQVVPVSASSLPLPAGAATSALQTTGNTHLTSIDTKTPAQGQALAANSSPVVLASDQSAIPVGQSGSWTVALSAGTAVIGHVVVDSGAIAASQAGSWTVALGAGVAAIGSVTVSSSALPTGAATAANQATANASLSSIDGKLADTVNGLKVDGSAVVQPVSGTFFQATQPVSAVSLPLPTGAATAALQTTGNTTLSAISTALAHGQATMAASVPVVIASDQAPIPVSISGDIITLSENIAQWGGVNTSLGQKVMASSVPVVLSSDQASIPVAASQSGTWNVTNVSGTVSLPTGASTAANQATANTSLSSIDGKTPTLGQKTMAASSPVTLASDQSAIPVSQSGTWTVGLSAGAALVGAFKLDDGSGVAVTSQTSGTQRALDVGVNVGGVQVDPRSIRTLTSGDTVTVVSAVAANLNATVVGSGNFTVVQTTGTNLHTVVDASALPTGASTSAKQPALGTAGTASSDVLTVQGIAGMTALKVDGSAVTQPVSGTFWQATQPVSAASLPLPTGAATAAKQPALGAAGTPSADVITVQGAASMTALKVDGSAVTQPVSGTVTANAGTGSFTVAQATAANLNATIVGTVTANIGTTNGLALDTSINGILIAQGSTTAGEKGVLHMGAVTAAAPAYSTTQSSPLSLTTAGALRVDGSAVTQPVSGTVTANAGTGNFNVVQATAASLNATVNVQDGAGNAISSKAVFSNRRMLVSETSFNTESAVGLQMYSFSFDFTLPTATTETPAVLFSNPNGSGKTCSLRRVMLNATGATAQSVVVRMYANPTTSAAGTTQTVSSTSIGGGAAAASATVSSGPTASVNGTRFFNTFITQGTTGSPATYDFDGTIVLNANNRILITGQPSANATPLEITFVWAEL